MAEISRAELKYLVERQREEIETLNQAGKLISSATEPKEIIRLVASYLQHTFPIALCSVFFLPQRKMHFIPFAPIAEVEIASAARQMREAAGELLNRTISEEDSALVLEELQPSARMQPSASLRSHLSSPITVNGQAMGLLYLFSGQAKAFLNEDRHTVGIVAEQLGAALQNAFLVEELRRAVKLKNELLSIVSHELSTPLTAIKEGINLVLDGALGATTAEQADFLHTVLENTERLERLMQKVKTSTELMTGQLKFTFESFDLRLLVANVEKLYRPLAESRGVHLRLVDYPKPLFWPIDMAHASFAVSQLVENAIQATPKEGLVTLKLSASASEAEVQVLDTGVGIHKEALPTLFEQFKSIGGIHDRKMGGLGLGLFLAKSLVVGHGGTITVDSNPGEGTLVMVRFPKQPLTSAP